MTNEQIEDIEYIYTEYKINCSALSQLISACDGLELKIKADPVDAKVAWLDEICLIPNNKKKNLKAAAELYNIVTNQKFGTEVRKTKTSYIGTSLLD